MAKPVSVSDTEVIITNLKRRYTGVTSTMINLVPVQAAQLKVAVLGCCFSETWPMTNWASLLRHGWSTPGGNGRWRILHCRRNHCMLLAVLLRHVLRMRLKLVFTSAAQRDHSRWTKWLLRQMDAVIATSPESGAFLQVPYTVNLHGIDTEVYHPAPDRAAAWAATGLPGKYGVGVFGRIRRQKGTDRFVEAMCELLPRHPDWTAAIIGQVVPSQARFAAGLKDKIKKAGLEGRVIFKGLLPSEEVPRWLRAVSIVAGPQRNEGFGLVPAEAMASGTAVVATRAGAAYHMIAEGQTGFLADINDMNTFTRRLDDLMSDPAKADSMGRAGREHVLRHFSVQREAEGIQKVYARLWAAASTDQSRQ